MSEDPNTMNAPAYTPLPPGIVGTVQNILESVANAGPHALGKGPLSGGLPGTLGILAGIWMGSQDMCRLLQRLLDHDGAGGSGTGSSTNSMHPRHLNCHFFGDPIKDPRDQCGGGCPPRNPQEPK